MSDSALIEVLRKQEKELVFTAFDEAAAFSIGSAIRERGVRESFGIVVEIRFWNRLLFYTALPGASEDNRHWARRKSNVVERWGKSSYRALIENGRNRTYAANDAADPRVYALHGGAFPIVIKGVGPVGTICVSGLPEADDHRLVVEAIADFLKVDKAKVALP
jgi:uncharacterized protein (UPF0303 family)